MAKKPECWKGDGLQNGLFDLRTESSQLTKELTETLVSLYEAETPPDLLTVLQVSKYACEIAHMISDPDLRQKWGRWSSDVAVYGIPEGAVSPLEKLICETWKGEPIHLSHAQLQIALDDQKRNPVFWENHISLKIID